MLASISAFDDQPTSRRGLEMTGLPHLAEAPSLAIEVCSVPLADMRWGARWVKRTNIYNAC
jgi:hypothetical protein